MRWRIIEVQESEAVNSDLTSGELLGISIILTHRAGEPHDDYNVYWRARQKIQPQVEAAIADDER